MKTLRGQIPWSNVDRRLRSMHEIWVSTSSPQGRPDATPEWFSWDGDEYVDPATGTTATIFIADDHVYRVRPHLVSAWSYATAANRTDWEP